MAADSRTAVRPELAASRNLKDKEVDRKPIGSLSGRVAGTGNREPLTGKRITVSPHSPMASVVVLCNRSFVSSTGVNAMNGDGF